MKNTKKNSAPVCTVGTACNFVKRVGFFAQFFGEIDVPKTLENNFLIFFLEILPPVFLEVGEVDHLVLDPLGLETQAIS